MREVSTDQPVTTVSPIAHGGGLLAAQRRHPAAPSPWLDLSTGINPLPYPLRPIPPAAWTRLPEPEEVAALEAAAAQAYGVADPASIVAAPGTQALIHLLPRLLPPCRVAIVSPTYAEHHAAWTLAGHTVLQTTALDAAAAITVIVRPNNPDGAVAPRNSLLALAATRLVIVDEAFADLETCSLAADLSPNLVLLRSFGKTYGLAGVRLGFALTSPARAATLRTALGPWAVSGPALHAGLQALPDAAWRDRAATRLAQDAARLDAMLHQAGCSIAGGTRLFRLAHHPHAPALAHRLASAGILVRSFAARPALLRFGLPASPAAWQRLADALA